MDGQEMLKHKHVIQSDFCAGFGKVYFLLPGV